MSEFNIDKFIEEIKNLGFDGESVEKLCDAKGENKIEIKVSKPYFFRGLFVIKIEFASRNQFKTWCAESELKETIEKAIEFIKKW